MPHACTDCKMTFSSKLLLNLHTKFQCHTVTSASAPPPVALTDFKGLHAKPNNSFKVTAWVSTGRDARVCILVDTKGSTVQGFPKKKSSPTGWCDITCSVGRLKNGAHNICIHDFHPSTKPGSPLNHCLTAHSITLVTHISYQLIPTSTLPRQVDAARH